MSPSTKTIVYDWNGTLFDDTAIACRCFSIVVEDLGYPPISLDAFRQHFEVPFDRLYRGLGLSETDIEKIGNALTGKSHDYYEPLADKAPLREGVSDFLAYAKTNGFRQIILSNHMVDPINRQLNRLKITPFITEVLANASREKQFLDGSKSERLQHYLANNGLEPLQTIIVGDSPEETHIAHSLGLISVAVTGGYVTEPRLRAAQPDYLIHSFSDMPALLNNKRFTA